MNKFCQRIKKSLKENIISQMKLAKLTGFSQSVINNYCTGKREPSLDSLILICNALEESSDYLLGTED